LDGRTDGNNADFNADWTGLDWTGVATTRKKTKGRASFVHPPRSVVGAHLVRRAARRRGKNGAFFE